LLFSGNEAGGEGSYLYGFLERLLFSSDEAGGERSYL
jgi:hypothetical protein